MHARTLLLAIPAAALLAGCASAGSTGAAPSDSALASAAQQVAQPVASPTPTGPCRTNACIASGMEQSLPGIVAKDDSVMTKATCKPSTVKHNAGNTYTVTCAVTYSDGQQWRGYATFLPAVQKVTFEPVTEIR